MTPIVTPRIKRYENLNDKLMKPTKSSCIIDTSNKTVIKYVILIK